MTTAVPLAFSHHIPVTPPPEHESFTQEPHKPHPARTQEVFSPVDAKLPAPSQQPLPQPLQQQQQQQQQPQPQPPTMPHSPIPVAPITDSNGQPGALDPQYLAMASRIAAYYQQRSQAVANYQQQRCQEWASMHRRKCQMMMQASMLVVAWYVRDRIQRRRRREKRKFRRGLSERCSRSRVTKGERVRRWVLNVPSDVVSQNEARREKLLDQEEVEFTMDKEPVPDKDAKLFGVADSLVRNQLAQLNIPLMGILSFDESDNESEEEEEEDEEEYEEEEEEGDDGEEYEDDDMEDEDYDGDEMGDCPDTHGSEDVHVSTGKWTGKRTQSSAAS